jgi:hypothetical protein
MIDLVVVLGVVAAFLLTASVAISFMFAAALRRAHPGIWRAHASPLWVNGRNTPWPVLRFMRTPTYRTLQVLFRSVLVVAAAILIIIGWHLLAG